MTNKYPARCSVCGHLVEAGEGMTERSKDGSWSTFH